MKGSNILLLGLNPSIWEKNTKKQLPQLMTTTLSIFSPLLISHQDISGQSVNPLHLLLTAPYHPLIHSSQLPISSFCQSVWQTAPPELESHVSTSRREITYTRLMREISHNFREGWKNREGSCTILRLSQRSREYRSSIRWKSWWVIWYPISAQEPRMQS